jgi:hypothetical protein
MRSHATTGVAAFTASNSGSVDGALAGAAGAAEDAAGAACSVAGVPEHAAMVRIRGTATARTVERRDARMVVFEARAADMADDARPR